MQVGASFLPAALQKQTQSGFYTQLHLGIAAAGLLSEMSSSSCMQGCVCPQLPHWTTSATNPAQSCLYPPSTAIPTAHLPSPPEGITKLEQKGSPHAPAQLCSRLEIHLFTGMPFPVTNSDHKVQNAILLLPLLPSLWAAPVLCPRGTLYCCLILFCKWARANSHSVRTSKFYACNSWLVKRK